MEENKTEEITKEEPADGLYYIVLEIGRAHV